MPIYDVVLMESPFVIFDGCNELSKSVDFD